MLNSSATLTVLILAWSLSLPVLTTVAFLAVGICISYVGYFIAAWVAAQHIITTPS
ncbi:MAG: hypothetical protein U5J78_06285 [Parasphingorhabdus sp.]|nr:hypothetical protein [Parasphingorhabdus sp.]